MIRESEIDIRALRQIGWDHWDPIRIRQFDDTAWQEGAADEYDSYLLEAATMMLRGAPLEAVIAYLDRIVAEHMAIGPADEAMHQASTRTACAIAGYLSAGPAMA